jgi:hypothetical protein
MQSKMDTAFVFQIIIHPCRSLSGKAIKILSVSENAILLPV